MLPDSLKLISLLAIFSFLFFPQILETMRLEAGDVKPEVLSVGDPAPDFELSDQEGKTYSISQFRGSKNIILYFYPMDDTPGCTKEACGFRDDMAVFDSLDTVVLGVSVDDVSSHERFVQKYQLNFPLLADVDKKVSELYGALALYGKSKRFTFLIDREGILRQIYRKVDVESHSQEIARFIRENLR